MSVPERFDIRRHRGRRSTSFSPRACMCEDGVSMMARITAGTLSTSAMPADACVGVNLDDAIVVGAVEALRVPAGHAQRDNLDVGDLHPASLDRFLAKTKSPAAGLRALLPAGNNGSRGRLRSRQKRGRREGIDGETSTSLQALIALSQRSALSRRRVLQGAAALGGLAAIGSAARGAMPRRR